MNIVVRASGLRGINDAQVGTGNANGVVGLGFVADDREVNVAMTLVMYGAVGCLSFQSVDDEDMSGKTSGPCFEEYNYLHCYTWPAGHW